VARANEEILFMAFSFTDDDIGESMIGRAEGGVRVQGVFEKTGSNTDFSYFPVFSGLGMDNVRVRVDGNGRIMHHKVIIIDRKAVLFGSFNFSENANRSNDENVVIINDPTFAEFFVEEFGLVWDEAEVE
jgi:phosphatidylserine/phosphatidylglycerophosphate/cardiolipin synthase-like enzyme